MWDNRDEDVYSKNLRAVFERHFNDTYDLSNHSSNFIGLSGTARGIPQRFTDAVQKICNEKSDTVFFAGRDQDLPAFVARLAQEGTWGAPGAAHPEGRHRAGAHPHHGRVHPVAGGGAGHDRRRVRRRPAVVGRGGRAEEGAGPVPRRLPRAGRRTRVGRQTARRRLRRHVPRRLHPARRRRGPYVHRDQRGRHPEQGAAYLPSKDDVFHTLVIPSISGSTCNSCLVGAAGTYGFEGPDANDQWPPASPCPSSSIRDGPAGGPGARVPHVPRRGRGRLPVLNGRPSRPPGPASADESGIPRGDFGEVGGPHVSSAGNRKACGRDVGGVCRGAPPPGGDQPGPAAVPPPERAPVRVHRFEQRETQR